MIEPEEPGQIRRPLAGSALMRYVDNHRLLDWQLREPMFGLFQFNRYRPKPKQSVTPTALFHFAAQPSVR